MSAIQRSQASKIAFSPWERSFPGQKDVFFSWKRKFLVSRYSSFVRVFPDVYCSVSLRSTVSTVEAIAICEVLAGFAQEGCLVYKGPSKAESKTHNASLLSLWNAM